MYICTSTMTFYIEGRLGIVLLGNSKKMDSLRDLVYGYSVYVELRIENLDYFLDYLSRLFS